VLQWLLEKGADPNVQGGKYGTALQAAAFTQNQAIVKLLLGKGADPDVQGENLILNLIEIYTESTHTKVVNM
ncbi:hypothetical protein K435DRAFT_557850, partial [Dendrothele bispora CBS 962.96]